MCGYRLNIDGILYAKNYEEVTRLSVDPIESVPLYHFHPGTSVLSIASLGANLPERATPYVGPPPEETESRWFSPAELVDTAAGRGVRAIVYAGPEALLWPEFLIDIAAPAREEGLRNILVTNGYGLDGPVTEIAPLVSAAALVFLGGNDAYHALGATAGVEPVVRTGRALAAGGAHLEAVFLVVQGVNDSDAALAEAGRILATDVRPSAVHVSSTLAPGRTPKVQALRHAHARLRTTLSPIPVYSSILFDPIGNDSACRRCGAILVSRSGPAPRIGPLEPPGRCGVCGEKADIIFEPA